MSDSPVECCANNVDFETYRELRDADAEVSQQYCLGRCGVCHDGPFLVVDGELRRGEYTDVLDLE
ncbi:MAG: DUF1450 domain-containing protein [Halobacteriaceae archaeon]